MDESVVQIDGPWTHRTVHAGGTRFHVVEAGEGPLVLLLHGFPQFWWAWRHQLISLPTYGYRAVAVDLRGYGASDKPPRGYDLLTLAADAAGLVRSLGEAGAIVVGHDWGGLLGWTMGATHPKVVRRLIAASAPHPLRLRTAVLTGRQLRASAYAIGFQLPLRPEKRLIADDGEVVGQLLRAWAGPGWPDQESERRYRQAIQIPHVAHSALEYFRWFGRSPLRPDGIRFARRMRSAIQVPTLQLHGALDSCVLPLSAQGSSRYVEAPYRWRIMEGAGHFPHEERPEHFDAELVSWLNDPEPDR